MQDGHKVHKVQKGRQQNRKNPRAKTNKSIKLSTKEENTRTLAASAGRACGEDRELMTDTGLEKRNR